jgi:hypothetical protein
MHRKSEAAILYFGTPVVLVSTVNPTISHPCLRRGGWPGAACWGLECSRRRHRT